MNDKNKILIIACGALAREIIAIKNANSLDNIVLQCLPAKLHNRPEKIPAAVSDKIDKYQKLYDNIYVAYGDCGTGGKLDMMLEQKGVERIKGPHCYSFFSHNETFSKISEHEIDAFYLTDFLVRFFDNLIWKGLGLDRHPQLRDDYFVHYRKLVYLAQIEDDCLQESAKKAAQKLQLEYEYRFTGYGGLQDFIQQKSKKADDSYCQSKDKAIR